MNKNHHLDLNLHKITISAYLLQVQIIGDEQWENRITLLKNNLNQIQISQSAEVKIYWKICFTCFHFYLDIFFFLWILSLSAGYIQLVATKDSNTNWIKLWKDRNKFMIPFCTAFSIKISFFITCQKIKKLRFDLIWFSTFLIDSLVDLESTKANKKQIIP